MHTTHNTYSTHTTQADVNAVLQAIERDRARQQHHTAMREIEQGARQLRRGRAEKKMRRYVTAENARRIVTGEAPTHHTQGGWSEGERPHCATRSWWALTHASDPSQWETSEPEPATRSEAVLLYSAVAHRVQAEFAEITPRGDGTVTLRIRRHRAPGYVTAQARLANTDDEALATLALRTRADIYEVIAVVR